MSRVAQRDLHDPPFFRYSDEVLSRFPEVRGGIVWTPLVRNGPTPLAVADAFRAEQAQVLERIGQTPLAALPTLAAWRRAFSAFGVKPTQYRSAAEALLRRLTKKGDLPQVNLLTDIGNLVSIRYGLPVAMLDMRQVTGGITVRFARGDEAFVELDSEETSRPDPGEVIFADEASAVHARRWCWRQSAASAAREETREVLVTVEGHHVGADADVHAALDDLATLLRERAGASPVSCVLSPTVPMFAPR